jgi:hypothetical protein
LSLPWRMLVDSRLTRTDLLVYAASRRRLTTTAGTLAETVGLTEEVTARCLGRLHRFGYLRRAGQTRLTALTVRFLPDRMPIRSSSNKEDHIENKNSLEVSFNRSGRLDFTDKAIERDKATGSWTPLGLLGHFYQQWRKSYGIDYIGRSRREDLRNVELLVRNVGNNPRLAYFCIEAFFSPEMAWVKSKTLDFMSDPSRLTRFVVPVATSIQQLRDKKPEWRSDAPVTGGVLHDPTRRK